MISIKNKKNCCGCSACQQICPKNCIIMKVDSEGFLYPVVEREKCVQCGLCEKVCPILNKSNIKQDVQAVAAYVKDENVRLSSSSGGVFTALATHILKENGVVFGAAFDEKYMAHHIGIENINDLYKLQGSKYLQSRTENTYQQAESFLKTGRKVLYTGTACQIAGLKNYLRKEYDNLYTVDILCHGVPSPKLWEKYLKENEDAHHSKITQVSFRKKAFGWKNFAMSLSFENKEEYLKEHDGDPFMKLFLKNICLRPSCHDCRFKTLNRPSDITIGDCWGIQYYIPKMDDDKGTSVLLTHSKKGIELYTLCSKDMVVHDAVTDRILPPTADSRESVLPHPNRKKLFAKLNQGESIEQLLELLKPSAYCKIVKVIQHLREPYRCKRVIRKELHIVKQKLLHNKH